MGKTLSGVLVRLESPEDAGNERPDDVSGSSRNPHDDVDCVSYLHPLIDETSYEAGIKVQLHTQYEPPFLHELGFGVAPGFQTFVSTQEQRVAYDCLDLLACQCSDCVVPTTPPSPGSSTFGCNSPAPSPLCLPPPHQGMDPSVLSAVWLKQPHATLAVCPCC